MSADDERELEERQAEQSAEDNAREDSFDGVAYPGDDSPEDVA